MDIETCTLFCGNLNSRVTKELLYELFLQAGPVKEVNIPEHKHYGFVHYKHESSVSYALEIYEGTVLFGQELKLDYGNKKKKKNHYYHQEPPRMQHNQSRAKQRSGSHEPQLKERRNRKSFDNYSYGPMSPRASMDRDLNSSSNHDGRSRKRSSYEDRDDYYKHPREKRSRNYRHSPERYDENRERTYRKGRESSYREDRDDSHRQRSSRTYYENDNKDDRHGRYHSYSQHENNRGRISSHNDDNKRSVSRDASPSRKKSTGKALKTSSDRSMSHVDVVEFVNVWWTSKEEIKLSSFKVPISNGLKKEIENEFAAMEKLHRTTITSTVLNRSWDIHINGKNASHSLDQISNFLKGVNA